MSKTSCIAEYWRRRSKQGPLDEQALKVGNSHVVIQLSIAQVKRGPKHYFWHFQSSQQQLNGTDQLESDFILVFYNDLRSGLV